MMRAYSSTRWKPLCTSAMLDWETDSSPRNSCLHPLRAAASRNSSSRPAWIARLAAPPFSVGSDRAKQLLRILPSPPTMLSSQKMITLPGKDAYSAATSATGRLRNPCGYITAMVQKSHRFRASAGREQNAARVVACGETAPCAPGEHSRARRRPPGGTQEDSVPSSKPCRNSSHRPSASPMKMTSACARLPPAATSHAVRPVPRRFPATGNARPGRRRAEALGV